MEDCSVTLRMTATIQCTTSNPWSAIQEHEGEVLIVDARGEEIVIGRCRAYRIKLAMARFLGSSTFDVLDAYDSEIADYHELLAEGDDDVWSRDTKRAIGDIYSDLDEDLLIISRLEIRPQHRGHRYGLEAMYLMVENLAVGCSIVAIKPFPLQCESEGAARFWDKAMRLDAFPSDEKNGTRKLVGYYGSLGFKKVKGTGLMVAYPLEIGLPRPQKRRQRKSA